MIGGTAAVAIMRGQQQGLSPLSDKKNPFTPDLPVVPQLFAGHGTEIQQISNGLSGAIRGTPQHILVQGERWIGKTSIARYAEALAIMYKTSSPGETRDAFYVSFCSLGSCSSIEDVCLILLDSFKRTQDSLKEKVFKLLGQIQGLTVGPVGLSSIGKEIPVPSGSRGSLRF